MDSTTKYPPYSKRRPYAIYSRYPEGVGAKYAEDLMCPSCGAEEIVVTKEFEFGASGMLGDSALCWICKREFQVTERCWHPRKIE